jgi:micrococcal nuclease
MIYEYRAKVSRIVDGDTVWLDVDLGFNVRVKQEFRLEGINTPEVVGAQKIAGLAAKAELERLLQNNIRVVSTKTEKYGRYLATLYVTPEPGGQEINVNEHLIAHGFAKPYTGEGPKPV